MAQSVPRDAGKLGGLNHLAPGTVRVLDRTPLEVTHILNVAVEPFPAAQMAQNFAAESYRRRALLGVLQRPRLQPTHYAGLQINLVPAES
jgi:hypothetical protein